MKTFQDFSPYNGLQWGPNGSRSKWEFQCSFKGLLKGLLSLFGTSIINYKIITPVTKILVNIFIKIIIKIHITKCILFHMSDILFLI